MRGVRPVIAVLLLPAGLVGVVADLPTPATLAAAVVSAVALLELARVIPGWFADRE